MAPTIRKPTHNLYAHVPFCAQKCSYCAFFSEPSKGEEIQRYVTGLLRELEMHACDLRPRTIFFGGGTPSLLSLKQWEAILQRMGELNLLGTPEFTIECNPATVSEDKARLLRSFGVNRVSMGVQSLDETLLDRLGRVHSREMVFKSFDILRRAGFTNVNIDLMFAIPGQDLDIWRRTLDEAMALDAEHLSTYEVIYEEDTALYAQLQAGRIKEDENLACAMFDLLVERAEVAGLERYEVANFARRSNEGKPLPAANPELATRTPYYACQHNVNYWRGGSFAGLGPSATGYTGVVRYKNWSNTRLWCELVEQGKEPIESREELSAIARAGETAAFGLRMVVGWPFADFRRVTGVDLATTWEKEIQELVDNGWGAVDPNGFKLTREGLRFADAAAQLFLR